MIISIHVPKTAGSSFLEMLSKAKYQIKKETTYPLFTRCEENNSNKNILLDIGSSALIHGHFTFFQLKQLDLLKKNDLVSWVRDPVERVVSHYYYWKENYEVTTKLHPVQKMIVENNLSICDFAEIDCMRNVQNYFLGENVEKYRFLGVFEEFEISIKKFDRIFHTSLSQNMIYINKTKNKLMISLKEKQHISKLNQLDETLYKNVLKEYR